MSRNTQGILCLVAALICLTLSDAIIKWLSPELPLHQVTLFRSCFALILVLIIVRLEGGLVTLKTRRPVLHFVRGSLLVLANMFFFTALAAMPLAETVTLFYTAPLFICIMSQPVLGEKVSLSRWLVITLGMIGVVIMLRPGTELFRPISILPVLAALCYAAMTMMTRKLGMQEKAGALTFYIQLAFIVISSLVGLAIGDGRFDVYDNASLGFLLRAWHWPDANELQLLFVCGAIVSIGGYLISQAYRLGEAATVAPFEYASLPFALIVGYYLWGDWPDGRAFIGTGMIVGSGLFVIYLENRAPRKAPPHAQIDY
ncbi:MAG: DMT family transporter [Gammaproteobacteria bacterium]|nr:MAG: DMT family transporter [Gammaproteobacteria bacterium]